MYLASASEDGTTLLHGDLSGAGNIILHSAVEIRISPDGIREEVQGALWDIFRPQDRPKIAAYLRDQGHSQPEHPIHSQQYYLKDINKKELREMYGVQPISFVQKTGDCVFIPVGAPHQVSIEIKRHGQ